MQLTFGDAEDLGQRKQTRRELFLAQMDRVVPWPTLLKLIAPHYPTLGRPGRQPYALATMLRIHFLQQWYALSDPAMEEALHDTPVMRRFAQLGGLDAVPDETTILNFRRLLETHGLAVKILAKVRTSELMALRWADFDLAGGLVSVRRALVRGQSRRRSGRLADAISSRCGGRWRCCGCRAR